MKVNRLFFIVLFSAFAFTGFSQVKDSAVVIHHIAGSAMVTNNGISLIPSFSLGKPAALLLMSLGGKRFTIDPDIRFSLEGKPWTMLFWARYKLVTEGKFRLHTGAHLGLNYRNSDIVLNGVPTENTIVRRYLAAELSPNYFVAKNISVGSYYLYSRGIDAGTVKNTHFITLNTNLSHIPLTNGVYLRLNPQVYYLLQDTHDGFYVTSTFAIAKNNFPFSVSSIINQKIHSSIPGSKNTVWNVSLVYSFNRDYVPKQPLL